MARGRKPEPRQLLKLKNSSALRKDRHKRPEPAAPDGVPDCPTWLDAEAKKAWRRMSSHLSKMGLLKTTDGEAIAAASQAWSVFVRTSRQVSKITEWTTDSKFLVQTNEKARNAWRQWCTEFGLTPSSRTRIDAGVEQRIEDEFEAWLDAGRAKSG